jgi:spore maturation protein CgeB
MIMMFNRSKINLNLNNSAILNSEQIKGRNFEVPACGGFLLTGNCDNLGEYYEFGKEVSVYGNPDEMRYLIDYYLKHDEERRQIAEAGYQRTMRDHTYSNRLNDIFGKIGYKK